jgi:hypothetical protein
MSKINELKKQHPHFNFGIVDCLDLIFPKSKYVEMMIKFLNLDSNTKDKKELIEAIYNETGLEKKVFEEKSYYETLFFWRFYNDLLTESNYKIFKKFIEFNEKNLITKNDLTSYKNFDEIIIQVNLAEIKNIAKVLERQVFKIFENDEWLIVKPLTYEASKKYGANTKWCTTMEHDSDYFRKYSKNGILIYCLNKNTGIKVAIHKELNTVSNEVSFWDIKDKRVDSMFCELPNEILDIIKNELTLCMFSNYELMNDEQQKFIDDWKQPSKKIPIEYFAETADGNYQLTRTETVDETIEDVMEDSTREENVGW